MLISKAFLAETAEALRSGKIELNDYINELCERIDAHEPQIQAFVPEEHRRERLLQEAAELQRRFPDPANRPPLYGIPVGVKDIFRVDGFLTRAGCQLPPEEFAGTEAACVRLLRNAGALIAGKTVTTEFAYFEPGPTRNPHNIEHTPGGSSSGSAAGLACGFFPLSLGTQTIGSVIRPAAFCGIIGFKPSFERIPSEGIIYFSRSVDHVGLFTQDIAGIERACSVLCPDWNPVDAGDRLPVLGIPEGKYLEQASLEGLDAFAKHTRILEEAGYTIKRQTLFEEIEELNARHKALTAVEAAQEHAQWFAEYRDLYRARTAEIILKGQHISDEEHERFRRSCIELRNALAERQDAGGIDIWISPPATGEAPRGIQATGDPIMNLPWTHAGLPTITIPAGMSQNTLPLGLQCSAAFREDERLVAWMPRMIEALRIARTDDETDAL